MGRKFIVELDDKSFEELKEGYIEAKKVTPGSNDISFEQFLSDLLRSYADVKQQMGSMGDNFKNLFSSLDASSIEQMLSKLSNFSNLNNNQNSDINKKETIKNNNKEKSEDKNSFEDNDLLNKFKS